MLTRSFTKRAILLACCLLPAATPTHSMQSGGALKTLPQGVYQCALPGDAAGAAWHPVEDLAFTIVNASSYETDRGRGTYLLKGGRLLFTRGPLKGKRFERRGEFSLRAVEPDGSANEIRCVRVGAAL